MAKSALVCSLASAAVSTLLSSSLLASSPLAFDWPNWRGPQQNGVSRERDLPGTWSPDGENLLWRKEEYATRSTPVVMNGRLYTICRAFPETTREGERVVCLNADTGELIWETVNNVFLSDAPAERVGWSSVVGDEQNATDTTMLGALFAIDGRGQGQIKESDLLWKIPARTVGRSQPLLIGDRLYAIDNGKTPDMGLINQRYTLAMNSSQELQIRSWTSRLELRFAKTIPFTWQPGTWYTMKLQGENDHGKAVLRGKVWPRDASEPDAWTIEAADATPNTTGSPGIFGNASDAEFYLDNVRVY